MKQTNKTTYKVQKNRLVLLNCDITKMKIIIIKKKGKKDSSE